jgi:hypothetical protein
MGGFLAGITGFAPGEGGPREFTHSGVLAPGDYLLEAVAESNGSVTLVSGQAVGIADFSFEFSIVPEPSTAASLCVGLALLGLRNGYGSRKRRGSQVPRGLPRA